MRMSSVFLLSETTSLKLFLSLLIVDESAIDDVK
jgi:hypothetical protein